jgi:glycosyltransferase involved in cell wall biosynthesis
LEVSIPYVQSKIKLGFLGRNFEHKNTGIFPKILRLLRRDYGLDVAIYVTFTQEEWERCSEDFRTTVKNVGPLLAAQCPDFYEQMDGIIFPSLLECFSITPLEAMAMNKPLFASDRPFNRDVCQDKAHYFDPTSPISAARVIAEFFLSGNFNSSKLQTARDYAMSFSSPRIRAEQYLDLMHRAAQ